MSRFTSVLILCLLTAKFLFSQDSYPKRIVLQNDTVIAVTVKQAAKINKSFYLNMQLKEEICALDSSVVELQSVILEKDRLCRQKTGILKEGVNNFEKLNLKLENDNRKLKKRRLIVFGAGFVSGAILFTVIR